MDGIGLEIFLILMVLVLVWPFWRQLRRRKLRLEKRRIAFKEAAKTGLSLNPKDYIFPRNSFKRSNRTERRFRRNYHFELLEIFDHACANCKSSKTKLEIDHFFIPKSYGGNLMMQHREGYWVSNGILLCRRCNANKADQSVHEFFEEDVLRETLELNLKTSFILNGISQSD